MLLFTFIVSQTPTTHKIIRNVGEEHQGGAFFVDSMLLKSGSTNKMAP